MINQLYIKRVGYFYDFYSDESLNFLKYSYSINHKIFKGTTGELLDNNNISVFTIFKKLKFIDFNDYLELELNSKKIGIYEHEKLNTCWYIELENIKYSILKNKGARFSIYKNETQIAGIIKNKIDFLNKSVYQFVTEDSKTINIQLALFLAINFDKSNEDAALTFEINSPFQQESDKKWFSDRFKKLT